MYTEPESILYICRKREVHAIRCIKEKGTRQELLGVIMDGIHAANRPALHTQFTAIGTGLDNQRISILFNGYNTAADAANGCDFIADLSVFPHLLLFLFPFALRAEEDQIQGTDKDGIDHNHDPHLAAISCGSFFKGKKIHHV